MTNSSSSDLEYVTLYPHKLGEATRPNADRKFYILWLQASAAEYRQYRWEPETFRHIYLDSTKEDMSRFQMVKENLPYIQIKDISREYKFEEVAAWIHAQTSGKWSMEMLSDQKKRPGRSKLVFFFEEETAALYFKMFQL